MPQIGNVPEIQEVKHHLEELKRQGVLSHWELPYESILTKRSAALFFLSFEKEEMREKGWEVLSEINGFNCGVNKDKNISTLNWKVQFDQTGDK